MKKLIICDTNYQLFVALQLKLTLFSADSVDVWVSDHSRRMDEICARLEQKQVFNNVKFFKTRQKLYQKNKLKVLLDVLNLNFGATRNMNVEKYDEVVFYGINSIIFRLSDYYDKIGHIAKWSRFEEGLFSYDTDFSYGGSIKLTRKIRQYIKKTDVVEKISRYYCFYPNIKETNKNWEFVEIPSLQSTKEKLVDILNYSYDYKPTKIKQKYIFFASSSDIDGNPFGETQLVLDLAKKYGFDNILVKMHPRDRRKVYEDSGIEVMRESFIPWELMQLNTDIENKVLLTVNSGAFISIGALYGDSTKAEFLFREIKTENKTLQERASTIECMLSKLHSMGLCKGIIIR